MTTHARPPAVEATMMSRVQSGSVFAAPFMPAVLLAACWIWWTADQGGYFREDWYPAAIGVVLLAVVIAVATGTLFPADRVSRIVLGLLAAFTAFCFLSMLWAESSGSAWEGSDKLLLFLATTWSLALLPWRREAATALLGAWAFGAAVVCAYTLHAVPTDPTIGGLDTVARLGSPLGYTNATAAMAWMAMLAALAVSYRRGLPVVVQAVFLAVAALLFEFGLIPQSRGAVLGLLVALPVFVAFTADRIRLLARMVALALILLVALGPILDVQSAADVQRGMSEAVQSAGARIILTLPIALVAGVLIGVVEEWVAARPTRSRIVRRGISIAAVVVGVLVLGLLAVNAGRIADGVSTRYKSLTTESFNDLNGQKGTRFRTLDTQGRTDAWRVALDVFAEHPVVGVGVSNYEREGTARREVERHSRYAHSIWLRLLSEVGLLGTGLFLAFCVAVFAGAGLALRRVSRETRTVVMACLAVLAFFLAQASVDWLEEFPALGAPAFGLGMMAVVLARRERGLEAGLVREGATVVAHLPRAQLSPARTIAAALVGAVATLVLALPYLSAQYTDRAYARYREDLPGAYSDLARAERLNPLSYEPHIAEGTIAINVDDPSRAKRAFAKSIDVEDNWYARMELGLVLSETRNFPAAVFQLGKARELNRDDVFLNSAYRRIRGGRVVSPMRFNEQLLRETQSRFTRPAS